MKYDVVTVQARSLLHMEAIGAGLLAGLLVCGWGCSRAQSGRPDASQSRVNVVIGDRLGAAVAETVEPGDVVLVHLSSVPGEAQQWVKGLRSGLGSGFSVIVMGPDQHPNASLYGIGGNQPLQYALQQHPDAKAVVTAIPVGPHERPSFSKDHPPIFALNWTFLPDAGHLFQGGHLVAGVFEQSDWDPAVVRDFSLSPQEMFDRNYVVVTSKNFRELVTDY